jgi:outer membrane protein assembly factor BamE (lipoprotein component of BamABCDE complex)
MNKNIFLTTCFIASLTACTPTIETRGNLISEYKQEQIEPAASTRYDVIQKWGPPTLVAPFDKKTWYYVGKTTESMGIFKHETIKQQIIKIKFDENDVVADMITIDPNNAKDIEFVERSTSTAGKEFTVLQQLIGNLGRFNGIPQSGN